MIWLCRSDPINFSMPYGQIADLNLTLCFTLFVGIQWTRHSINSSPANLGKVAVTGMLYIRIDNTKPNPSPSTTQPLCDIITWLVLWQFPFVNLWSVLVGFYEKPRFTVRFRFLRFQILIMCRANTNDTGENTCIAAVQNSDLRHSGRSRCNGELIIISILQVVT